MAMQEVALLKRDLSNDERMQFDGQMAQSRKEPSTALILSILLGWLGIDRFYLGQTGLGFGKLFTLGGLWVWYFIDLFLIAKAARRLNYTAAQQIHDTITQMRS